MSLLAASAEMAFTEIRDTLKMTDGNVTAHLRTLHEAGYISVTKSMEAGRGVTTYALTSTGRKAFNAYVDLLEAIVEQTKKR